LRPPRMRRAPLSRCHLPSRLPTGALVACVVPVCKKLRFQTPGHCRLEHKSVWPTFRTEAAAAAGGTEVPPEAGARGRGNCGICYFLFTYSVHQSSFLHPASEFLAARSRSGAEAAHTLQRRGLRGVIYSSDQVLLRVPFGSAALGLPARRPQRRGACVSHASWSRGLWRLMARSCQL